MAQEIPEESSPGNATSLNVLPRLKPEKNTATGKATPSLVQTATIVCSPWLNV